MITVNNNFFTAHTIWACEDCINIDFRNVNLQLKRQTYGTQRLNRL